MPLPYFFEENIPATGSQLTLSEETSKHCIQVLRMQQGEELQLTDGKGIIALAFISFPDKRFCQVVIKDVEQIPGPKRKISVAISLLKNASRFEWFLEKATEIGVTGIIPLLCQRTERQHFRFERMQGILVSAMLQSQQAWLPVLQNPLTLGALLSSAKQPQKFVAHCLETHKQTIPETSLSDDALILIGPEGDFTPEEINNCLKYQCVPVTLGNTRLRTETAGLVAATLLANC